TLEQQQRVKTRTAEQSASIAAIEAERRREAESARILAERKIEEAEIERQQIVRTRQVEAEREVAIREIEQQQATEIASQARAIAVAAKSEEQSQAEARASKALAEAVQAQQDVETTRQTAEADRTKQVALIAAAQEAETKAVELTVRAQAEKEAAELQAAAIIELAEATRQKGLAEAEAQRALNDAINVLSDEQTSLRFRLALLDALPAVIEKSTEPMKSIDGIKIIQVDGLNGGVTRGKTATTDISGGNLAEQAVTAALAYRTQAPLIDSLLKEVGLSGEGLTALTRPLVMPAPEKVPDVSEPVTAPDNSEPQQV
ncbi:TPA: flotillin domain-containing protein, partial [Escherichia coli]